MKVSTVTDKQAALAARAKEQRELAARVQRMYPADDAEQPRGCGICNLFRRARPARVAEAGVSMASAGAAGARVAGSALFGVKKTAAAANAKLAEAVAAMEARVQQLEGRVQAAKAEAARLHAAGNKAQALRVLKKAKASEKSLETAQSALDAVERQYDVLEAAEVQKQLASALGSTSKKMKADKKMLSKAESAVDEASEVRDLAADLESVVTEFAQNGSAFDDEDELLAELDALVHPEQPPLPPTAEQIAEQAAADERAKALQEVQRRHQWEEAEKLRQALPEAPVQEAKIGRKAEEKKGLLQPA